MINLSKIDSYLFGHLFDKFGSNALSNSSIYTLSLEVQILKVMSQGFICPFLLPTVVTQRERERGGGWGGGGGGRSLDL